MTTTSSSPHPKLKTQGRPRGGKYLRVQRRIRMRWMRGQMMVGQPSAGYRIYANWVDDMDDFIVPDDSDDDVRPSTKRKRPSNNTSRKSSSSRRIVDEDEVNEIGLDLELPEASTARQWTYDPENPEPLQPRSVNVQSKRPEVAGSKYKNKAHMTEPEQR